MEKLVLKWVKSLFSIIMLLCLAFQIHASQLQWYFSQPETEASRDLKQVLLSILEENEALPDGDIGISALNTNTGEVISLNGEMSFFMASTYKIAIATQILTLVDKKLLSLNQMITVKPKDIVPGSGILVKYFKADTFSLSLETLLQLMMQESDNTATDLLLHLAGGPLAVSKRLQELNITNLTVDRYTIEFTRDYFNVQLPPEEERNYDVLLALYANAKPDLKKFLSDKRDNTTPNAMVKLLNTLYQGKALSDASTKLLFTIMSKKSDETGRLYYFLPGVKVIQKLGTGDQVVNDVGILYLPNQRGGIILSIYMRYIPSDQIIQNKISAQIAKTIYDYFLFQPVVKKGN